MGNKQIALGDSFNRLLILRLVPELHARVLLAVPANQQYLPMQMVR